MKHLVFAMVIGGCASVTPFDGTLLRWNAANGHAVVDAPLRMGVKIGRPIVEIGRDASDFSEPKERFVETLHQAMIDYASAKRVFERCCGRSDGAYGVKTTLRVLRYRSNDLSAEVRFELLSPKGDVLLTRDQAISQRLRRNVALDDRFAFHEFLTDTARLWTEQLRYQANEEE